MLINNNFICLNCQKQISGKNIGTVNRNHCPRCLYSKHVDKDIPGDRKADCQKEMKPVGLTFKLEGINKYGQEKQGELMLIHECIRCAKISINRIAGDDNPEKILQILTDSQNLPQIIKDKLKQVGIKLLTEQEHPQIKTQLFGR